MREKYNSMFDELAPLKSDEELLGAVLSSRKGNIMKNNENKSKKRISKAIAIPVAAALALGATAVGAVAIHNHNVNEEYARVLDYETYGYKHQTLTDKDGNEIDGTLQAVNNRMYEELNIELDKSFECDGFNISFPGAMCDGETMLLFYTVTFDEGWELDPRDHFDLWWEHSEEYDEKALSHEGRGTEWRLEKIDGKMVYTDCIPLCNIQYVDGDVLSIHFIYLDRLYGPTPPKYDIDITLDIPLSDELTRFNKNVDVVSDAHIDLGNWGDWDVDNVKITPLNVTFNMSTDHETPEDSVLVLCNPVFPMIITFKDGSVLNVTHQFGGSGIDEEARTFFLEKHIDDPIDVENVATIQIASAVIDMDGSVTTVEIPEVYEKYDENGHMVEKALEEVY